MGSRGGSKTIRSGGILAKIVERRRWCASFRWGSSIRENLLAWKFEKLSKMQVIRSIPRSGGCPFRSHCESPSALRCGSLGLTESTRVYDMVRFYAAISYTRSSALFFCLVVLYSRCPVRAPGRALLAIQAIHQFFGEVFDQRTSSRREVADGGRMPPLRRHPPEKMVTPSYTPVLRNWSSPNDGTWV